MTTHSDRPWMTALEMQFATLAVVRKLMKMPGVPASATDTHVLATLHRSAPFSWTSEITSAVWAASETIPETARFDRDLLPEGLSAAWWWLTWPIPMPMKFPAKRGEEDFNDLDWGHLCALLLSVDVDGFWTISCARMSTRNVPFVIETNRLASGLTLHDLVQPGGLQYDVLSKSEGPISARDIRLFRFVLGASVWLKQRIAVISDGHIERHRRKQLAREFDATLPSDVKVIQLRRAESAARTDTPGEPVEWSCRWVVSGHWRNQYHPSDGKHELQYILPYVKGPEDKPLRIPSHTVYAVNR